MRSEGRWVSGGGWRRDENLRGLEREIHIVLGASR